MDWNHFMQLIQRPKLWFVAASSIVFSSVEFMLTGDITHFIAGGLALPAGFVAYVFASWLFEYRLEPKGKEPFPKWFMLRYKFGSYSKECRLEAKPISAKFKLSKPTVTLGLPPWNKPCLRIKAMWTYWRKGYYKKNNDMGVTIKSNDS